MQPLALLALRVAIAAAATALAWWLGGLPSSLVAAALSALLLARPIVEALIEAWRLVRVAAWRDVEGRHMAFHGRPLRVHEDAEHRRWVRVADVRAIVGFTASEATLLVAYPSGARRIGNDLHLSDDALVLHLSREPGATALKLRHWVERQIAFPAQRVRRRLGIHVPGPESAADS